MQIISESTAYTGRLMLQTDNAADKITVQNYCVGASPVKNSNNEWSVADTLVNRVSLGLPIDKWLRKPLHKVRGTLRDFKDLDNRLTEYQVKDVTKLLSLRYAFNANPMGYGKTVEACIWAKEIQADKILIICPKVSKKQWALEVSKWLRDDITPQISPKYIPADTSKCIVITNYEQLINYQVLTSYKSIRWDCIILDEAHRIKNAKARTTQAIKSLPALNKMCLSGTPILNKVDDLWSTCQFLNEKYFGNTYWGFVHVFCEVEDTFWGKKIKGIKKDDRAQQLLKDTLSLFMVRNPEGFVGNGIGEYNVTLEMYPAQKSLYHKVLTLAIEELLKSDITVANGMSQLIRMQQIASNPGKFDDIPNVKFEWIRDLLVDNPEEKILVFSKFKETILALNHYLQEGRIPVATIHGDVSEHDREVAKQKFTGNPEIRVLTGTLGAISESIDGLQKVCHIGIFIDREWNPEDNNQAIGRLYRYLQDKFVERYNLVCEGTVDEKVGKVNIEKIEDIKTVLGVSE